MSRLGKVLLAFSAVSFLVLMVARAFFTEWRFEFWFPLGFAVLFLVGAVLKDLLFYKELFMMRTTKHGLNLGAVVLILIALLVAVNYIAYVHDKKFDVTEEKLNSLSDQTKNVLASLKGDLEIRGFYKTGIPEEEQEKMRFQGVVDLYKAESPLVKGYVIDPNRKPKDVEQFKVDTAGQIVLTYLGKNSTLGEMSEEALTNTIIKLTREKNKIIYSLNGHRERDMDAQGADGASRIKKALEDASYTVKPLNLVSAQKVPADADGLLIIGGVQPLLPGELTALKDYLNGGGHMLVAIDPGQKTNLGQFVSAFGIEFKNNFVLDQLGQMVGASAAMAIGLDYSKTSEITKKFTQQMTAFQLASSLAKSKTAPAEYEIDELVKSSPASFAKKEIAERVKMESSDEKGPLPLAMSVTGKVGEKKDKDFALVVVGDSDFLSNQMIDIQLNRDLALNMVSFLSKDKDLISIRAKQPKGTTLTMTQTQATAVVLGLYFPLPLILGLFGGVVWFRRRGA